VGAVTGNRWYRPQIGNWGSLVRYFWNAGAVVQVWFNGIVWGGSMALRRECIDRIGLLDAWSHALFDDATVYSQVNKHDLQVRFAPGAMMLNSETIALPIFRGWVRRQLVAASNCADGWAMVMLHGLSLAGTQLLGFVLFVLAVVRGEGWAALITAGAVGVYWIASIVSVAALELGVRRIARLNGLPNRWLHFATLIRLLPAIVLTHVVYTTDLIAACFCRRVSWRGIDYNILGKNHVRMVSYRPFHDVSGSKSLSSIV
jgi:cellulose synthase/poly-beta-1,6-N-acetylglucosamine synthase-like glycosyltransferase